VHPCFNIVKPAYTQTADRSQMAISNERNQHTTKSLANGSSSSTYFQTKKETHLKPCCGMWTGQAVKNKCLQLTGWFNS
jgi:hypothetical protein